MVRKKKFKQIPRLDKCKVKYLKKKFKSKLELKEENNFFWKRIKRIGFHRMGGNIIVHYKNKGRGPNIKEGTR